MRRSIISTLVSVAFLLMAFVSCQKETSVVSNETTIVFNSSRPQLESDTKTVWNGDKIQWSKGDAIRMAYTVDGIWQNADGSVEEGADAKFYASTSTTISDDCQCATFMISGSFKGAVEGSHVFYALYPSSAYASSGTDVDPAEVKIEVPSTQTCSMSGDPGVLSFDSSADLMYGVSVGDYNARPASVDISWQRKVAHAYITLKDLAEVTDGEIVSSITLTANDGAALAGTCTMNLQDGTLTPFSTTNQVVINGTNLQISEGDIVFWACMMPCTWSAVTVVVETDKAIYTRDIASISGGRTFKRNARNLLTIDMTSAVREEKVVGDTYSVISRVENLADGTYYMGGNNKDLFSDSSTMYLWEGTVNKTQTYLDTKEVMFSAQSFTEDISSCAIVTVELVEGTSYYIKVGDNYLSSSGTDLSILSDSYTWTVQNDDKDGMVLVGTACSVSINSSGETAIRAYSNNKYKGIYFFKKN